MIEKHLGSAVEKREFSIADLKIEIELVRQGGMLSFPSSMYEILDEIVNGIVFGRVLAFR